MIRQHIRDRRLRLDMKQRELARRIGAQAQSTISAIERGQATSPERLAKIDQALTTEEQKRGLPPLPRPRDHRLAERRRKLNLSAAELGELAGFRVGPHAAYLVGRAENGDAEHIPAVRRALIWMESDKRRRREERRRDEKRIAFQRSLWAELPDHPAVRALKAAMLDRCLDLMHEGSGTETDAISEFLPADDVGAMFDQWEQETNPPQEPTDAQKPEN